MLGPLVMMNTSLESEPENSDSQTQTPFAEFLRLVHLAMRASWSRENSIEDASGSIGTSDSEDLPNCDCMSQVPL